MMLFNQGVMTLSNVSSTASARARAIARKAVLEAERQMLARKHDLAMAAEKLKQEQERLALDTEMSKAVAEEKALAAFEEAKGRKTPQTAQEWKM